jgi:class 3 adenylate cyclase
MQKLIARYLTPLLEFTGNEEVRRASVTYHIAVAGVVLGVGYALMNALLGIWVGALANLVFGLLWMFIARLCRRGLVDKSRHFMLFATNIHILLTALFIFGPDCGGHHYLLASATVGSLFFTLDEWGWKLFYLVFGLTLYMLLEYGLVPYSPIGNISLPVARVFDVVSIVGTIGFIFVFLYSYQFAVLRAERKLDRAHRRSEELLLNILPLQIAERLKVGESVVDRFEDVTVLFADISSFTKLATEMVPVDIVQMLNEIFSAFDSIADSYGLEKIKTIGDAYMVAGGIPEEQPNHVQAVANMAIDMRDWLIDFRDSRGLDIGLRVGIHSGPVVAGVIGSRKFIYDLWGDTVNLASRMESHGIIDQIQLSQVVAQRLRSKFQLVDRGEIAVKGKGKMPVYLLAGRIDVAGG